MGILRLGGDRTSHRQILHLTAVHYAEQTGIGTGCIDFRARNRIILVVIIANFYAAIKRSLEWMLRRTDGCPLAGQHNIRPQHDRLPREVGPRIDHTGKRPQLLRTHDRHLVCVCIIP